MGRKEAFKINEDTPKKIDNDQDQMCWRDSSDEKWFHRIIPDPGTCNRGKIFRDILKGVLVLLAIGIVISVIFLICYFLMNDIEKENPKSESVLDTFSFTTTFRQTGDDSKVPDEIERRKDEGPFDNILPDIHDENEAIIKFQNIEHTDPDKDQPHEKRCTPLQLPICRGLMPWILTTFPNHIGDNSVTEAYESLPYFQSILIGSQCSPKGSQYICALLEPPCSPVKQISLPPCRKFCEEVVSNCSNFIDVNASVKNDLAFQCEKFPDSDDAATCVDVSSDSILEEMKMSKSPIFIPSTTPAEHEIINILNTPFDKIDQKDNERFQNPFDQLDQDFLDRGPISFEHFDQETTRKISNPFEQSNNIAENVLSADKKHTFEDKEENNEKISLLQNKNRISKFDPTGSQKISDDKLDTKKISAHNRPETHNILPTVKKKPTESFQPSKPQFIERKIVSLPENVNIDEDVFICDHSMFLCEDGSDCVDYSRKCDGVKDCLDNTDELSCTRDLSGNLIEGHDDPIFSATTNINTKTLKSGFAFLEPRTPSRRLSDLLSGTSFIGTLNNKKELRQKDKNFQKMKPKSSNLKPSLKSSNIPKNFAALERNSPIVELPLGRNIQISKTNLPTTTHKPFRKQFRFSKPSLKNDKILTDEKSKANSSAVGPFPNFTIRPRSDFRERKSLKKLSLASLISSSSRAPFITEATKIDDKKNTTKNSVKNSKPKLNSRFATFRGSKFTPVIRQERPLKFLPRREDRIKSIPSKFKGLRNSARSKRIVQVQEHFNDNVIVNDNFTIDKKTLEIKIPNEIIKPESHEVTPSNSEAIFRNFTEKDININRGAQILVQLIKPFTEEPLALSTISIIESNPRVVKHEINILTTVNNTILNNQTSHSNEDKVNVKSLNVNKTENSKEIPHQLNNIKDVAKNKIDILSKSTLIKNSKLADEISKNNIKLIQFSHNYNGKNVTVVHLKGNNGRNVTFIHI